MEIGIELLKLNVVKLFLIICNECMGDSKSANYFLPKEAVNPSFSYGRNCFDFNPFGKMVYSHNDELPLS